MDRVNGTSHIKLPLKKREQSSGDVPGNSFQKILKFLRTLPKSDQEK
jgi:hypothetical protein